MGRSKSALRASREKKAESKAAGINHNKRLAMALKAKGAPRPIWDPPRMSVTPSPKKSEPAFRKVKAEPKSPEPYSGPTLRSSTASAAVKAEKPHPGRTLRSHTTSSAGNVKKEPYTGPTLRSSAASHANNIKKIQKIKDEMSSESVDGPTLRSSTISSAAEVKKEQYSGPTLRSSTASSNRGAIQKIKDELSSKSSSNSASDSIMAVNSSEPHDEPKPQPEAEHENDPEQEAEPKVKPEPGRAQRTTARAHCTDFRKCIRCGVWGFEYPPLHVVEEEEEF
ncbi:uncharacterized protein B0T23DRAFT_442290 [Neurospora hispaniola]|uniref:Uncharacterized protein n=1 Tax=Neurospora hispaniola TaxID=588809 RepID=A0AAJ0I7Z9_9PEZI|nr:hypothetical protein B0T23DRAFT_442290 [Neurospora hispaniola]